jgi:hypothetical protein
VEAESYNSEGDSDFGYTGEDIDQDELDHLLNLEESSDAEADKDMSEEEEAESESAVSDESSEEHPWDDTNV